MRSTTANTEQFRSSNLTDGTTSLAKEEDEELRMPTTNNDTHAFEFYQPITTVAIREKNEDVE